MLKVLQKEQHVLCVCIGLERKQWTCSAAKEIEISDQENLLWCRSFKLQNQLLEGVGLNQKITCQDGTGIAALKQAK